MPVGKPQGRAGGGAGRQEGDGAANDAVGDGGDSAAGAGSGKKRPRPEVKMEPMEDEGGDGASGGSSEVLSAVKIEESPVKSKASPRKSKGAIKLEGSPVKSEAKPSPSPRKATPKKPPAPPLEQRRMGTEAFWVALGVEPQELRIDVTLVCGQSFRWRATGINEWSSVLGGQIVSLMQTPDNVLATAWVDGVEVRPSEELLATIRDYFALETSLAPLYEQWAAADATCCLLATGFPGLRVLRQDPLECLFSFICSSNNNIARIAQMIEALCVTYGIRLGKVGIYDFHSFPTLEALLGASEEELRGLGMGYRAKFIVKSAEIVRDKGGPEWLYSLRKEDHIPAREQLEQLSGVGSKVADCVCLMALDKTGSIPVDTHVWQITIRDFDKEFGDVKSVTPTVYQKVGDLWRGRYGAYAGWAHTILFAADLVKFKERAQEAMKSPTPTPEKKAKPQGGGDSPKEGAAAKRKL